MMNKMREKRMKTMMQKDQEVEENDSDDGSSQFKPCTEPQNCNHVYPALDSSNKGTSVQATNEVEEILVVGGLIAGQREAVGFSSRALEAKRVRLLVGIVTASVNKHRLDAVVLRLVGSLMVASLKPAGILDVKRRKLWKRKKWKRSASAVDEHDLEDKVHHKGQGLMRSHLLETL